MLEITSTGKLVIQDNAVVGAKCIPVVCTFTVGSDHMTICSGNNRIMFSAYQLREFIKHAPDVLQKLKSVPEGADVVELRP